MQIDTSKPLEILYNSSKVPENCRFIGINDKGKIVIQFPGKLAAAYMTFEHSGIGTYSPQHSIRNVKAKTTLYYRTMRNKVNGNLYTYVTHIKENLVPHASALEYWDIVDKFEREVEL